MSLMMILHVSVVGIHTELCTGGVNGGYFDFSSHGHLGNTTYFLPEPLFQSCQQVSQVTLASEECCLQTELDVF